MRIVKNDKYIERRKKIGAVTPFVGLAVLLASTVILFVKPEWIWITMILVWIGLLAALTGSYLGERFVGPVAYYKTVPDALKGLDDSYTLVMYQSPVPFLLVDPGGVTVLTIRSHIGEVAYTDGKWRHHQRLALLKRFVGQEGLGRPDRIAADEVAFMEKWLAKAMPAGETVPVQGVVLFTNPEVHLTVKNPPLPVLRAAEMKRWIRRENKRPKLADHVRAHLLEALGAPHMTEPEPSA